MSICKVLLCAHPLRSHFDIRPQRPVCIVFLTLRSLLRVLLVFKIVHRYDMHAFFNIIFENIIFFFREITVNVMFWVPDSFIHFWFSTPCCMHGLSFVSSYFKPDFCRRVHYVRLGWRWEHDSYGFICIAGGRNWDKSQCASCSLRIYGRLHYQR